MRESSIQNQIRLAAAQDGVQLLRQNSGALQDRYGQLIRFGLANESKAMNKTYKSGDLVGIRPVVIGPEHIGMTLGVFISLECKNDRWRGVSNERERAQERWNQWVKQHGGLAGFANSVEMARKIWADT